MPGFLNQLRNLSLLHRSKSSVFPRKNLTCIGSVLC